MSLILFFDTETTGLPDWKSPSEAEHQPHLVELAALVVCPDTREIVHSLNLVVRPDGWEIPTDTVEVHGITTARAMQVGVPERFALEAFLELEARCAKRIAYNAMFDDRIMRIAIKRYIGDAPAELFKERPVECAMRRVQKHLGGRNPKLEDAYRQVIGSPMTEAHSAHGDCIATARLWWALPEPAATAA